MGPVKYESPPPPPTYIPMPNNLPLTFPRRYFCCGSTVLHFVMSVKILSPAIWPPESNLLNMLSVKLYFITKYVKIHVNAVFCYESWMTYCLEKSGSFDWLSVSLVKVYIYMCASFPFKFWGWDVGSDCISSWALPFFLLNVSRPVRT